MNPSSGTHNAETYGEMHDAIKRQQANIYHELSNGKDVVIPAGEQRTLVEMARSLYETEEVGWTQPGALRILSVLHPSVEGGDIAFNVQDLRMAQAARNQEAERRKNSPYVKTWRERFQDPANKVEFALTDERGQVTTPWTNNPAIMLTHIEAHRAEVAKTGDGHGWGGIVRSGANSTRLYAEELEAIVTMQPQATYDALAAATKDTIKSNLRDLEVHDYQWIRENKSAEPFIHFAHDLGTVLVPLLRAESPLLPPRGEKVPYAFGQADREFINEQAVALTETAARMYPQSMVHVFGGIELKRIDVETALKVVRAHVREVQATWSREMVERKPTVEERWELRCRSLLVTGNRRAEQFDISDLASADSKLNEEGERELFEATFAKLQEREDVNLENCDLMELAVDHPGLIFADESDAPSTSWRIAAIQHPDHAGWWLVNPHASEQAKERVDMMNTRLEREQRRGEEAHERRVSASYLPAAEEPGQESTLSA